MELLLRLSIHNPSRPPLILRGGEKILILRGGEKSNISKILTLREGKKRSLLKGRKKRKTLSLRGE
jgi:hypothetical protein